MKKLVAVMLAVILCCTAFAAFAEDITLKVWDGQDDQELLKELCEAYAAAHPENNYNFQYGVVGTADASARYLEDPAAAADVFVYPDDQLIRLAMADALYEVTRNHDEIVAANSQGSVNAATYKGKIMGVMTGEEQLGITKEHEFIIRDLANGGYCFNIVPTYGGEKGTYSVDANVEVKNDWVIAPTLKCEQTGDKQVKLTWKAPANIEQYHITVYTGDNNSILRFVDLDYSKYTEFDLTASEGDMEYIYEFDKDGDSGNDINLDISIPGLIDTSINLASGQKLKFEIYGIRHTESGAEQKSATSSQTINLK